MTMMIAEVYDALIEAGASQEKSRKAAEAIAGYESRFAEIEKRLERMEGKITLLSWMVGASITLTLALGVGNLFLSFQLLARLPHS
jgi:ABC-type Fe3+-hydroxamate transport system substrate-binding protein